MSGKSLIVIRSHRLDDHLLRNLHDLRARTRHDVKIVLHDEDERHADDDDLIRFSSKTLEGMGVGTFGHPQWAWFMGDCAAYVAFDRQPACDHLLMVEYDVKLNCDIDAFVDGIAGRFDLVAQYAGFSDPTWAWHAGTAKVFKDPRGCFFPLVGVSRRLADKGREARAALSWAWDAAGAEPAAAGDFMLHCEALLPTVCAHAGWPMGDLQGLLPGWDGAFFRSFGLYPWDHPPLDGIAAIHPCFPGAALPAYFAKAMASPFCPQDDKDRMMGERTALAGHGRWPA